jgi:hypothetical protein
MDFYKVDEGECARPPLVDPPRHAEIEGVTKTLLESCQHLLMACLQLEKRLDPVLSGAPPQGQTSGEKPSLRTGLGNLLAEAVDQVQCTNQRIDDILNRLEL